MYICDRACKNQTSSRIKIALFFELCLFITYDLFKITTQNLNGESYKDYRMKILLLDIHEYLTRCNLPSHG